MTGVWLVAMVGILGPGAMGAQAEIIVSEPVNVGAPINDTRDVQECDFSHDSLELYYAIGTGTGAAGGGYGGKDIFVSKRETPNSPWQEPVNLGPVVNSAGREMEPSISADSLELYFGCWTDYILRVCTRPSKDDPWGSPVMVGAPIGYDAYGPDISADGLSLYFASMRSGGYGGDDLWVTTRATTADPWGQPVNLGPDVNSGDQDWSPSISNDGLMLVFSRGLSGIWATMRRSVADGWGPAVQLEITGPGYLLGPALSPDGSTLYFQASKDWGGYGNDDFWQVRFIPVVDFNGDDTVDAADMALLVADWGKNNSSCDIGPFAWGDGIVDEKDLMVLTEWLMTPAHNAADVPCDVVLSWMGPSFADSYDVYLGTSFDDVNNATRDDPCGVLVSVGQTETTFDPEGVLEFSQTYYWRVDSVEVVLGSLDPVIYRGSVLSFTTEAYVYPIQSITAKASSSQGVMGPEKTVDGSGLGENDGHSTDAKDMWQSKSGLPQWIQFEFDQVYTLHELWVWNSNTELESLMSFGAKTVTVEYSTDGTTWTPLDGVPEFAKAPGTPGYTANTIVSFGGVSAKHVKLTIEKGWGAMPVVGLSEVRFFHIPDRP